MFWDGFTRQRIPFRIYRHCVCILVLIFFFIFFLIFFFKKNLIQLLWKVRSYLLLCQKNNDILSESSTIDKINVWKSLPFGVVRLGVIIYFTVFVSRFFFKSGNQPRVKKKNIRLYVSTCSILLIFLIYYYYFIPSFFFLPTAKHIFFSL